MGCEETSRFVLDKESILQAAENAIRRYGPGKTNLTDIAKALSVSHAAIYRYYADKADLLEAVTERWLARTFRSLDPIMRENTRPEEKLRHYLQELCRTKRACAATDPELFENYAILSEGSSHALKEHISHILNQMESIIRQGIDSKAFIDQDPRQLAVSVFIATSRFHHPAFASEWQNPDIENRLDAVLNLILSGMEIRS